MKSFSYVIKDELGIHARPAGLLVKEAKKFNSKAMLEVDGKITELTKLLALMNLGIKRGNKIKISIEGGDEEAAARALETFFKENL